MPPRPLRPVGRDDLTGFARRQGAVRGLTPVAVEAITDVLARLARARCSAVMASSVVVRFDP